MYDLIAYDFNRLFDNVLQPKTKDMKFVDSFVAEDNNSYKIDVDIPGIPPENIEVAVEDNVLKVSGRNVPESSGKARERVFSKSWTLSREIDINAVTADIKHGVLTLCLPKVEKTNIKSIPINTS